MRAFAKVLNCSLLTDGRLSYFGLHPVHACDELGMSSSFLGQSINECRTGALTDSKGETPTLIHE